MSEDCIRFDLDAEIRDSESRKPWPSAKQARTLINKDGLRLVLFTWNKGPRSMNTKPMDRSRYRSYGVRSAFTHRIKNIRFALGNC